MLPVKVVPNPRAGAAFNAEVPAVFDRHGKNLFGDQSTRAGPNAAAAGDAQTLVDLDHRVQFIGIVCRHEGSLQPE
jgi:hypothetical protein